ncbi:MerR family transcriptional regulator [Marinimicrobium koreense]|uniref:MerR family transcriptional regulator n=1 Tax=Marinimicrobium koreense TaxID=306545 RepID=UPI003F6F9B71
MPTSEDRESMVSEAVPIRRVSELTGVNSVTLRAWERRYGLLKPLRTAKGHRLYRPEDIARVEAIQRWLARGVAVGQVRALLDQGAEDTETDLSPTDPWQQHRQVIVQALAALDVQALRKRLAVLTAEYPMPVLVDHCIEPLLSQWRSDVGQGRPQYGVTSQLLCFESVLYDYFASARHRQSAPKGAPRLLLVDNGRTPDSVLPMILAYSLGVNRLQVDFFGPVPQAEWLYAVDQREADAVLLYTDSVPEPGLEAAHRDLERQLAVPIWLAGRQTALVDSTLQPHCLGQSHSEILAALEARLPVRVEGPDFSDNGSPGSGASR